MEPQVDDRTFPFANRTNALAEELAHFDALDRIAGPTSRWVAGLLENPTLKDALSGTWLGHPVHPMLTDLPIGFWTSAFVLDFLGGKSSRRAAQRLVGLGILSAIPTAVTGAADWSDTDTRRQARRRRPRRPQHRGPACLRVVMARPAPAPAPPRRRTRVARRDTGGRRGVPRWASRRRAWRRRGPHRVRSPTGGMDAGLRVQRRVRGAAAGIGARRIRHRRPRRPRDLRCVGDVPAPWRASRRGQDRSRHDHVSVARELLPACRTARCSAARRPCRSSATKSGSSTARSRSANPGERLERVRSGGAGWDRTTDRGIMSPLL